MATSIVINGRRTSKPGAHTQVKSQTGAGQGPSARGIVAILGTSEGGKPLDATSTFADATTPDGARRLWRDGNLRKAALFAFAPSIDDAIPGGAQKVVGVKVNPATQSSLELYDFEGSPVALATSENYGAFTERISIDVENGTSLGKRLIYNLDNEPEEFDNVGGGSIMRILTQVRWPGSIAATAGHVRRFIYEAVVAGASVFASNAAANAAPYVNGVLSLVSTLAGDTMNVTVYGLTTGGVPANEVVTLNGVTPVPTVAAFSCVTGIEAVRPPLGVVTVTDAGSVLRLSLGATAFALGVAKNASAATLSGRAIRVWAAFDPAEAVTRKVVVRGTDIADAALAEVVTLNGATPVTLAGAFKSILQVETGDVSAGKLIYVKALASTVDYVEYDTERAPGLVATPFSSPTAQGLTLTPTGSGTFTGVVRGIIQTGAYATENVSVTNAPVTTTATFRKVLGIEITGAPTMPIALSGAFVGSLAVATSLYGAPVLSSLTTVPAGAPVYVRATSKVGRVTIAVRGVTVGGGSETKIIDLVGDRMILVSSTWARLVGIDYLQVPSDVSVELLSPFLTVSGSIYNTVAKMVAKVNADTRIEASQQDASASNTPFSDMDSLLAQTNLTTGADFTSDLRAQIRATDQSSNYVVLTRDAWSAGSLGNIGSPRYLVGGTEGVTTIAEWTAAFRALKKRRVNTVIVLTEDPAVHQLLFNYVRDCVSILENEANGYVGLGTTDGHGETRTNIKSRIRALQGRNLCFISQEFLRADPDTGESLWWPPYMHTAIAAGMQAGAPVGEPLTKKLLQVDDVRNDSSWNVQEDVEEMIDSGLMMVENDDNSGIQWVRSITGFLQNNDPVFCEMSAVESLNESVYNLRTFLNHQVGTRALNPTVGNIKSATVRCLTDQAAEPIIRDWRPETLVVEEIGDQFPVTVEVLPILGVNFIPITVNVGITRTTP